MTCDLSPACAGFTICVMNNHDTALFSHYKYSVFLLLRLSEQVLKSTIKTPATAFFQNMYNFITKIMY